ncbi:DUF881 domain-containing protein [Ferroacidibacillus organovorans]|uniref:DUF881 domain-containing protein n=1 Tax=Ferroacidibacillus organovorans TaxID=1765683 RepID=A0A101XQ92_9BACL|nr:DUF881 domain-containing protein [Ferroacidibacillus organovorans]KUO95563.1 hypothetical protein ATW55_06680 [Ferroacidibacillus organovorans]
MLLRKYPVTSVAVLLGVMIGLELHMNRMSPAVAYSSYLNATNALSQAIQKTPVAIRQLAAARAQLKTLEDASEHTAKGYLRLQSELNSVEKQAGLTPWTGTGIVIRISYDPNLPVIPGLRFVDEATQLRMVVNILESAGAQAIAINGQRLVTTSSIRSVMGLNAAQGPFSSAVQINEQPVDAPYVIEAAGNPAPLSSVLNAEGLADQFRILDQAFRVTLFRAPHLLRLPAYTGPLPGAYAKESLNA